MSIKFENTSFTYQAGSPFSCVAVKNVNLQIEDNEFVSIIGHTGSGKSTLAQLINSLLRPTDGRIVVGDFVVDSKDKQTKGLKNLKKYAGMVFQFPEYQLFEETVIKDVAFGPKNFNDDEETSLNKAKQALKLVGINEELFDKSPFELSGGQKRRVAMAGIIALEPKILILDEPTAGLDPKGEEEILELFNNIHKQGTTIIMISHNMDNVLKYSTRAIVMNNGEITFDGKPIELFKQDDLITKYNIDAPKVVSFAKDLIKGGFNIDLNNIKDIDSLIDEIERGYHE